MILKLQLQLQYFGRLIGGTDSVEKTLKMGKMTAGGEGDDRGWDGWMALLTRCTWVWEGSRCWWWTGKPVVLQSMGSQSFWHNWLTDLNHTEAWESGKNGSWEVLQSTIKVCNYFTEWEEGCGPYEAPHFCVQNVGENKDQKLRTARERLWKAVSIVLQFITVIAPVSVTVFGYGACGIFVPQEDMWPVPPAVEVFSLNHWTDREVPAHVVLSHLRFFGIIDELYIYSFNKVQKEVQVIS